MISIIKIRSFIKDLLNFFKIIFVLKIAFTDYEEELSNDKDKQAKERVIKEFKKFRLKWLSSFLFILLITCSVFALDLFRNVSPLFLFFSYSYWAISFGFYSAVSAVGQKTLGGKTLPERADKAMVFFFAILSFFFSLIAIH